ncbi:MAG: prepilin peptidase [Actinomycetota bacterium]|jgi:hypothetical protein|nr:prepilin peptidase [Actinomycetota bacterium]
MTPATARWALTVIGISLFGLVIGSFLNVVIYRLPRSMSVVRPASHCPACAAPLGAAENVPLVSWVVLRARCRHCGAPISPRYPFVELATGLVFFGLAWARTSLPALPSLLVVAAASIAAAGTSFDDEAIPGALGVASGLGAASLVAVALATGQPQRIGWAALGAIVTTAGVWAGARPYRPSTSSPADPPDPSTEPNADLTQPTLTAQPRHSNLWRGPGWSTWALGAALGWSASWLWPPGGVILGGWLVAVAVVAPPLRRVGRSPVAPVLAGAGALGCLVASALVTTHV